MTNPGCSRCGSTQHYTRDHDRIEANTREMIELVISKFKDPAPPSAGAFDQMHARVQENIKDYAPGVPTRDVYGPAADNQREAEAQARIVASPIAGEAGSIRAESAQYAERDRIGATAPVSSTTRPEIPGEMTGETWRSMSDEAKEAYRGRNDLLWRIIRVISPGASGYVENCLEHAIQEHQRIAAALAKAEETSDIQRKHIEDLDETIQDLYADRDALRAQVGAVRAVRDEIGPSSVCGTFRRKLDRALSAAPAGGEPWLAVNEVVVAEGYFVTKDESVRTLPSLAGNLLVGFQHNRDTMAARAHLDGHRVAVVLRDRGKGEAK